MKTLLGEKLHFDWKVTTITIVSTLLIMLNYYHFFTPAKHWDQVILFLIVPLAIILILFRENPKEYGFSLGDWKAGLIITSLAILIMTPVIYFLGRGDPAMQEYYKPYTFGLPWVTFLELIGWEFLFRGWMLFGYARKFGPEALWLQAVPFAIAHISKPEVETLSTIFGGFVFGWIAYRTQSFVWPFLIHWFVLTFMIAVSAGLI